MNAHLHGFTLMEALITLLLVLLGLTGALRLHAGLLAASADAKAHDEAAAFAQTQIAEFRTFVRYVDYRDLLVPGSLQRQGMLHHYHIEWDVEHHPNPDYKRVDLRVLWPAESPAQRIEIQTLLPGLEPGRFARQQLHP
jgi:type II secretory pathway pseudopilin PulG